MITKTLLDLGFSIEQTGGGCQAFIKRIIVDQKQCYVLITDRDGCDICGIDDDNWIVGLYDSNTDGEITIHYSGNDKIESALHIAGIQ